MQIASATSFINPINLTPVQFGSPVKSDTPGKNAQQAIATANAEKTQSPPEVSHPVSARRGSLFDKVV